jgi:hypothetical protein
VVRRFPNLAELNIGAALAPSHPSSPPLVGWQGDAKGSLTRPSESWYPACRAARAAAHQRGRQGQLKKLKTLRMQYTKVSTACLEEEVEVWSALQKLVQHPTHAHYARTHTTYAHYRTPKHDNKHRSTPPTTTLIATVSTHNHTRQ